MSGLLKSADPSKLPHGIIELWDDLTVPIIHSKFPWLLEATIKDAVLGLDAFDELTWLKGTWITGNWHNGTWRTGTWINGIWLNGSWGLTTNNIPTWHSGVWVHGTWYSGWWDSGEWRGGTWKSGIAQNKLGIWGSTTEDPKSRALRFGTQQPLH